PAPGRRGADRRCRTTSRSSARGRLSVTTLTCGRGLSIRTYAIRVPSPEASGESIGAARSLALAVEPCTRCGRCERLNRRLGPAGRDEHLDRHRESPVGLELGETGAP